MFPLRTSVMQGRRNQGRVEEHFVELTSAPFHIRSAPFVNVKVRVMDKAYGGYTVQWFQSEQFSLSV